MFSLNNCIFITLISIIPLSNIGSVVLCMDNDDAGVAAVTRLCTGSEPILLSVRKKSKIDILVANLPKSVKDPAEFLEENRDVEGLDEKFRDEAIQNALEWSVWYMFHLIAAHDPSASNGEDGSFSQIFDNVASFLSIFESIDERTKKAEIVSSKLADLVDTDNNDDNNRTEVSSTTRIQLASNLVEKAASIAHSKSISFQRNFQLTRGSTNNEPSRSLEISGDMNSEEDTRKFDGKKTYQTPDLESVDDSFEWTQKKQEKPPMKRQRARMKRGPTTNQSRRPMTKHITGIRSNAFDDEWLGVTKDKVRIVLPRKYMYTLCGSLFDFISHSFVLFYLSFFHFKVYKSTESPPVRAKSGTNNWHEKVYWTGIEHQI